MAWCEGRRDGKSSLKGTRAARGRHWIVRCEADVEERGVLGVAVRCVDIVRETRGEGEAVDSNLR